MYGAAAACRPNTVKLPWDTKVKQATPNSSQKPPQISIPSRQASIDPETLKDLVEFQEIVTEGVPLLLKLFNKLMKNRFAKPLIEVLMTCDKQNFMVSCLQGMFQKLMSILTPQSNQQAQAESSDGAERSNGHARPHMYTRNKKSRAQTNKGYKQDGETKNTPSSDDECEGETRSKSGEDEATEDKVDDKERLSKQSDDKQQVKENFTKQAADIQRQRKPLDRKSVV